MAKEKPGLLTFGSAGIGAGSHLAGELLAVTTDVKLLHVPYKGDAPAIVDLMGGQITIALPTTLAGVTHVKNGKLRALAVTSQKRIASLPDVPTVDEALGISGFEAVSWRLHGAHRHARRRRRQDQCGHQQRIANARRQDKADGAGRRDCRWHAGSLWHVSEERAQRSGSKWPKAPRFAWIDATRPACGRARNEVGRTSRQPGMPGSVKPRMAAAATEDAFNSGRIAPGSSWRARGKCRHRPGPWHDATMKLQCLQTLAAVLRHDPPAAAAQEVHLSAGAVSLQMQQLEVFLANPCSTARRAMRGPRPLRWRWRKPRSRPWMPSSSCAAARRARCKDTCAWAPWNQPRCRCCPRPSACCARRRPGSAWRSCVACPLPCSTT